MITLIHDLEPDMFEETNERVVIDSANYVDGIPSHTLNMLERIEKSVKEVEKLKETISVYGIINAGFFEGEQTKHAFSMIENWCERVGFKFVGGLGNVREKK